MARLVNHAPSLVGDVLPKYRHDGSELEIVNDNRAGAPRIAAKERQYLHLMVIRALLRAAGLTTDESIIGLNDTTTTERR